MRVIAVSHSSLFCDSVLASNREEKELSCDTDINPTNTNRAKQTVHEQHVV